MPAAKANDAMAFLMVFMSPFCSDVADFSRSASGFVLPAARPDIGRARHRANRALPARERVDIRIRAPIILETSIWIRLVVVRHIRPIGARVRPHVVVSLCAGDKRSRKQRKDCEHDFQVCCSPPSVSG